MFLLWMFLEDTITLKNKNKLKICILGGVQIQILLTRSKTLIMNLLKKTLMIKKRNIKFYNSWQLTQPNIAYVWG
jgi:hypothetical protein